MKKQILNAAMALVFMSAFNVCIAQVHPRYNIPHEGSSWFKSMINSGLTAVHNGLYVLTHVRIDIFN